MELYQHVFNTVMAIWEDEQLESIYDWVLYRGFLSFNDIHEQYHYNPESIKNEEEYKVNRMQKCLNSNIIQKITLFTFWMSRERECGMNILHDEYLQTLTRDQFLDFRKSIKSRPNSKPPPDESYTPMTTFTGHTKHLHFLNHKLPSTISKGEQKGMHQPIASSRMTFTMTLFKDHS